MNTIGFIGAGNMGSAILRGIAGSDMKPEAELFAYNPTEAKVDALSHAHPSFIKRLHADQNAISSAIWCSFPSYGFSIDRAS